MADLTYTTGVDNAGLIAGLAESKQLIARHAADVGKMQFQAPTNIAGGQFFGTHQFVPPASTMNAMIPARGTPGGFAFPGGAGGPFVGGSGGGSGGAAVQSIAQLGIAIQQTTIALQSLTQTVNVISQASGGGGAGGPGRGGGLRGGGVGTQGISPYMNPFSGEGLSRLVGSGAAVYGVSMGAGIVGNIAEGFQTIAHPARQLAQFQGINRRGAVGSDAFMTGQAQRVANIEGGQQLMNSFDTVPILGGITRSIFKATGATGAIEDELREARQQMQVHEQVREMTHGLDIEQARLTGNTILEAKLRGEDRLTPALMARGQGILQQVGPAEMAARDEALDKARRNTDLDVGLAEQREGSRIAAAGFQTRAVTSKTAAIYNMTTGSGKSGADALAALQNQHEAQRNELEAGIATSYDGKSATEQKAQAEKNIAARIELEARQGKELEDLKRQSGQRIIALSSEQQASELRVARQGYEAQLLELKTANDKEIAELQAKGATAAVIQQAVATNAQRTNEVTAAHDREMGAFDASVTGNVAASNLRAGRQYFAARVTSYDAQTNRAVMAADAEHRRGVIQERAAGRVEMGAEHQFEVMQEAQSLQVRQEQAAIRSDPTMQVAARNAVAGIRGQVAGYQRALNNVLPENVAGFKKTALMELQAQQDQANAPQTSGYASVIDTSRHMIGDPRNALPGTLQREATDKALDQAKADVAKQNQQQAIDPTLAGIASKITGGLMRLGLFGGGDTSRGGKSGSMSEGTGQEIAGYLKQLVTIASSNSGMGAPFGH